MKPVNKKVMIPNGRGFFLADYPEILYFKTNEQNSIIYTIDSKKLHLQTSLTTVEEYLPENLFCRVSQSIIVNLFNISNAFVDTEQIIELIDGTKIPVSRRRRTKLIHKMKKYFVTI